MQVLFELVRDALLGAGEATGFTYREVNVALYFGLIPLLHAALIDKIRGQHVCKGALAVALGVAWVAIDDREVACDAIFAAATGLLSSFGGSWEAYVAASLVFCVLLPLLGLAGLLGVAYREQLRGVGAALRRAPGPRAAREAADAAGTARHP